MSSVLVEGVTERAGIPQAVRRDGLVGTVMKRPLVPAAACFALGVLAASLDPGWWAALTALCAVMGLIALRRPWSVVAAAMAGFAALGAARFAVTAGPGPEDVSRFIGPGFRVIRGMVAGPADLRGGFRTCQIAVSSVSLPDGSAHSCIGRVVARLSV